MASKLWCLLLLWICFKEGSSQSYGDSCSQDGVYGICTTLTRCPSAMKDFRIRHKLKRCGFHGEVPILCCPDSVTDDRAGFATPASAGLRATTPYVPTLADYKMNIPSAGGCAPISPTLTSPKTNQIAWNKCLEYQELIYPCEKGVAFSGELSRANHCQHNADELIVGGVNASRGEFPHMVLLGFDNGGAAVTWECGGSLLSNKFILTAGHCTYTRKIPVKYAITGNLKRTDRVDLSKVHRIRRIIKHPGYKPPSKYNDIALLEIDGEIKLDHNTVPACLDVGGGASDERAAATGWGALSSDPWSTADILQKVTVTKFTQSECRNHFRPGERYMKQGYDHTTQTCYGDHTVAKDTCQGDSGGPLQTKNPRIHCMYTIVGVTSFGKPCGTPDIPGIYTRVSHYVPWIESIVWA